MKQSAEDLFSPFLRAQSVMIIDGGLATTLEARGWNLDDDLWSARVLLEAPEDITQVHTDFLRAGADCIIASTYQASYEGFARREIHEEEASKLMALSVALALRARDEFWAVPENRAGRERPLVAASVGPYGAALANGAEYTGDYGIDENALHAFHASRWNVLARSGADLLACETIPSIIEARVLLRLTASTPEMPIWMSLSCADGKHLHDGTQIREIAGMCNAYPLVAAVGVNCTEPQHISELVKELQRETSKPVLVYPNSGEHYDPKQKSWSGTDDGLDAYCDQWSSLGVMGIGGCCRVGPEEIKQMRTRLIRA